MSRNQMNFDEVPAAPSDREVNQDPHIFTVSEINKMIRQKLEGEFNLIWLKGEISNFKPHSSGHHYFSLKDEGSQISAVMFRGFNSRLKFRPENGMEVVVRGRVTVYEPRGNYQIFCEIMEPVGLGALQAAFEQLKNKLKAEGLFDPAKKRPLPFMPRRIAIVTSPTGAAIRDMLNVLKRRARGLEVILVPAVVQGAQAPADLIRALDLVKRVGGFDVVIIGRGGGSMEDLWAFNDEGVARAIAACPFPTVSGVGHEVDFTIADFVADLRAPTPSAAAELVVKNTADLAEKLRLVSNQLQTLMLKKVRLDRQTLATLEKGLIDPKRRLQDLSQRLDEWSQRLENAALRLIEDKRSAVEILRHQMVDPQSLISARGQELLHLQKRMKIGMERALEFQGQKVRRLSDVLDSLSPLRVVARGYSIVRKAGQVIKTVKNLKKEERIEIQFAEGRAQARIEGIEEA